MKTLNRIICGTPKLMASLLLTSGIWLPAYAQTLAVVECVGGASPIENCSTISSNKTTFEVTPLSRQSDNVTVTSDSSNALISVSSEFGIGQATVKLTQGEWPATVTVRLYLKGLEGFTANNGTTTIEKQQLSVQAYDQNMAPSEQEYLMDEVGYYEVRLPASLFTEGTTDIRIQWVDFYR